MTLHDVVERCAGKPSGGGWFMGYCPCHADAKRSLGIGMAGGHVRVHCFAGCDWRAVRAALGMESKSMGGGMSIDKVYDYRDESGQVVYQKVRYYPKDFRWRRPDGMGGWHWDLQGVRRLPYRLADILERPSWPVIIVEGEKDADRLASLGLVATTGGGCNEWSLSMSSWLRGRSVAIIPDNDTAGEDHAVFVAGCCLASGASQVRLVYLPGLPDKGDVSDFLDAEGEHGKSALVATIRETDAWGKLGAAALRATGTDGQSAGGLRIYNPK